MHRYINRHLLKKSRLSHDATKSGRFVTLAHPNSEDKFANVIYSGPGLKLLSMLHVVPMLSNVVLT